MSKDDKKVISIEQIIDNPIRVLDIPGLGLIKIKDPTIGDRLEATKEAQKNPNWKNMDERERGAEVIKLTSLLMLVEPKISFKEYYKANDLTMITVLDTIAMDYGKRIKKLTDKRKRVVDSFLEEMKKEN